MCVFNCLGADWCRPGDLMYGIDSKKKKEKRSASRELNIQIHITQVLNVRMKRFIFVSVSVIYCYWVGLGLCIDISLVSFYKNRNRLVEGLAMVSYKKGAVDEKSL